MPVALLSAQCTSSGIAIEHIGRKALALMLHSRSIATLSKTRRVSEAKREGPYAMPTYQAQFCSVMANFSVLTLANALGFDNYATSKGANSVLRLVGC